MFSIWYCVGAGIALGVLGWLGTLVASAKGHPASTGFWLGFWLGPLGILIVALLPTAAPSRPSPIRESPRKSRPVPLRSGYEFPEDCLPPPEAKVFAPEEEEAAGWLDATPVPSKRIRPL
jgi:hypothetical protein